MKVVFLVYFCVLLAIGSARLAFQFPSGYQIFLSRVDTTFSCADKPYGYYADPQNECKVFHVCNPIYNVEGEAVSVDQFSFLCGNQTIFNQETLTCTEPSDAIPCEQAPNYYALVNALFGRLRTEFVIDNNQSHPNKGQDQSHPNNGQVQPQPNNGQVQPHPNKGQDQSHPNNGQVQPQPNNGQVQPQPNNGQVQPQPNNGQVQPQPNNGQIQPQPNNGQIQKQPNNGQIQPQPNNGQIQPQPNNGQIQPQPNNGQNRPLVRIGERIADRVGDRIAEGIINRASERTGEQSIRNQPQLNQNHQQGANIVPQAQP